MRGLLHPVVVGVIAVGGSSAGAEVTGLDSHRHQAATALADVDFARKHCRHLRIDGAQLAHLITRARQTEAELRAGRDHHGQAEALEGLRLRFKAEMVCGTLPGRASHGVIP